jgi:hypothetical protein
LPATNRKSPAKLALLREMAERLAPTSDIAAALGTSGESVRKWAAQAEIPLYVPIGRPVAAPVTVPEWARAAGLAGDFATIASEEDEFAAAAYCRRVKRTMGAGRVR